MWHPPPPWIQEEAVQRGMLIQPPIKSDSSAFFERMFAFHHFGGAFARASLL